MTTYNHIPVFLASDNNYAKLVAVTAVSILENTNSFIEIIVLNNGISNKNKTKIKNSLSAYKNYSLEFININKSYINQFPSVTGARHVTKTMYGRFLIPELKPEYDKVIYSDADIIYTFDIKKLYDENLDGYTIGAIPCAGEYLTDINHDNCRTRLNIDLTHKYFSSGLLLIDLKKWNKDKIGDKILKTANEYKNKLLFGDQDILNICFNNNYKVISLSYTQGKNPPEIIHFSGAQKPWNSASCEYSDLFWEYAKKTLFYQDFESFYVRKNSPYGIFLKIIREVFKLFPYFLVHKKIKTIDEKIVNT